MKKLLLFTIPLFFIFSAQAQDMKRVRTIIDTLTSPSMHGRGYQNSGDKIAANYIQDQYKEMGLGFFPDSTKKTSPYFQHFKFDVNQFHFVQLSLDSRQLELGKDYLVHPASPFAKGYSTRIYHFDTLLFSNPKVQSKFLKKKIEKYVIVFPASYLKRIYALPKNILEKFFEAGCLIELVDGKLVYSVSTYQYKTPYFQVKKEAFPECVKNISFGAAAYMENNYQTQNVICFIKGKSKPDSFIVVSAHYDHLGRLTGNVYFPGANDNASGISMMLELAKHYTAPENQPDYSIVFMAFSAEEAGLIGSDHYVKNPLFPLKKIKFLINLDLLGTGDEGITVVNATKFPKEFDMLASINEEKKLLAAIKKRGPAANSDHYHFTEKGVPAFFIYTMGGIAAYHDIYDRAETLPLTKFTEVFQLLTNFISKF